MDIERLIRMDEEAILLEEDIPLVRSLSMSRNMASSILHGMDEVSHMIRLVSTTSETLSPLRPRLLQRSFSTSSLARLNFVKYSSRRRNSRDQYDVDKLPDDILQSLPLSLSAVDNNPELIRIMGMEGVSLVESKGSSLSQINFPSFVRGGKKNELLTGIVVSRWDNIVGPQCVYLWTEEVTSLFYPGNLPVQLSGVVKYVTDHTVDHQDVDGNVMSPSTQRTTLCIVPDLSLVYIAISIRVPSETETVLEFASSSSMTANDPDQPAMSVPHAISILANLQFLSHFLELRPLLVNWLNEFAPKIGVLLCKNKLQNSMINSWCAELCKTMTTLKTCWVQESPVINSREHESLLYPDKTKRTDDKENNNKESSNDVNDRSVDEMDYLPPNLKRVPKFSWGPLLTSHLSTFGSSIIVGLDNLAVNQVIRFLLCFSSNQEGYCSRYNLPSLPDTFMKGLFIQGLTLGGIGERSISYNQVTSSKFPITHIEMEPKVRVRQVNPHTHFQARKTVLMQELRALWTSFVFISPITDPFPLMTLKAAGFVNQFIEDLQLLPPERRYSRLILFRRSVHSRVISLITYLHSIIHLQIKERLKLIKLIPEVLGLDEQEFLIVQVAAEKLKPGIMRMLFCS